MTDPPQAEALPSLCLENLRGLWKSLGASNPPPRLKPLLLRELAWRIQSQAHGDLDPDTRRLVRAAIRNAHVGSSSHRNGAKKAPRIRQKLQLPTGAKLVRRWRGRKHEATVLDQGKRFSYQGVSYDSLTEIAEKITSTHWSGPRFFGLHRLRGMA